LALRYAVWYASSAYVVEWALGTRSPREVLHELEDLGRLLLGHAARLATVDEAIALRLHLGGVFLAHGAAQLVRLAEREARQLAGHTHDLFLVGP
jgi:hypothetical protein